MAPVAQMAGPPGLRGPVPTRPEGWGSGLGFFRADGQREENKNRCRALGPVRGPCHMGWACRDS